MRGDDDGTAALLDRAEFGDRSAIGRLLERHRTRLRGLVARRLDRRLAARLDPSDVVQDALAEASKRLPEYLRERPIGFLAWLRGLTLQRLGWCQRAHFEASKRNAGRPASAWGWLDRLPASGTSPSGRAIRDEERACVGDAVLSLTAIDREILTLRYDEGLAFADIAGRLGVGVGAANMRHLRAIEHLHSALGDPQ